MDLCSKLNQYIKFTYGAGRKLICANSLGGISTRCRDTLREEICVAEGVSKDIFADFIFVIFLTKIAKLTYTNFFC